MHKRMGQVISSLLLLVVLAVTVGPFTMNAEAVKVSKEAYTVNINGQYVFLGSEIAGSTDIGTEYYMTYTVQSAPVYTMEQQGLIGSVDVTQRNPFENGGFIRWTTEEEHNLLKEGYTYFIKFTAAEGGFTYDITRAKGDIVEKVYLSEYWGWPKGGYSHFGIWISGQVQANLTKVHCYDASGKNLGLTLTPAQGHIFEDVVFHKDTKVDHKYDVKVTDKYCVTLSNRRVPTSDRVWMEYTVKSSDVLLSQEGVIFTGKPLEQYPYNWGAMRFESYLEGTEQSLLLEPGASYIIRFDRNKDGFETLVQKTKNGERTMFTFTSYHAPSFDAKAGYFGLWFGDWSKFIVNFELTDFKCYDSNGNNLGVQCSTGFTSKHYGEHEDYAGCEAMYYCKENNNLLALYKDQTLKQTVKGTTTEGTYTIADEIMKVELDGVTQEYDYMHYQIRDDEGNLYIRLKQYTVRFVTEQGIDIPEQVLSNENGYVVMKPTDPVIDGKEFEGWFTGDGKKFDFDKIVTESTILYAKYAGEKLQVGDNASIPIVPIVVGVVTVAGIVGIGIFVVKRGAHRGRKVEE